MSQLTLEDAKAFADAVAQLNALFFKKYPVFKPILYNVYLYSSGNYGLIVKDNGRLMGKFTIFHSTEGNIVKKGIEKDISLRFTVKKKHFDDIRNRKQEYCKRPYLLIKYIPLFLKAQSIKDRRNSEYYLVGEKTVLRPGEDNDLQYLFKWYNDAELNKLAGWSDSKVTVDKLRYNLYRSYGSDPMNLMIDDEDGRPIGTIQLYDFNDQDKSCKLGIRIGDRNYWGKGYGEDAVNTLLEYAFMQLDLYRVTLKVYEYNERAARCYVKCGFKHEGRTRQSAYIDGAFYDELIMGALKSEFIRKRENLT